MRKNPLSRGAPPLFSPPTFGACLWLKGWVGLLHRRHLFSTIPHDLHRQRVDLSRIISIMWKSRQEMAAFLELMQRSRQRLLISAELTREALDCLGKTKKALDTSLELIRRSDALVQRTQPLTAASWKQADVTSASTASD